MLLNANKYIHCVLICLYIIFLEMSHCYKKWNKNFFFHQKTLEILIIFPAFFPLLCVSLVSFTLSLTV